MIITKKMRRKRISVLCAAMLAISMLYPATASATSESEELVESTDSEVGSPEGNYAEGEAIVKVNGEFYQYQQRTRAVMPFEMTTLFTMTDDAVSDEEGIATYAMDSQGEEIILAQSEDLTTDELIQEVQSYPGVVYAEPNYDIYACEVDDPYYKQQWHLHKQTDVDGAANVETVWDTGATGSEEQELVVAVIDSGVDYKHPDLENRMWDDGKEHCGYDFVKNTYEPMDVQGHGTHVAGIIGAQGNNGIGVSGVSGVCQSVKLAALRVLDDYGSGSISSGIRAYQYMIDQKMAGKNFVAANNSWGGSLLSRAMEETVAYAGAKCGIVSVFSSGNSSEDRDKNWNGPESTNRSMAITVNASDCVGNAASFSNFGKINTDLYAPGVNVMSTYQTSDGVFDIRTSEYVLKGTELDMQQDLEKKVQPVWLSEDGKEIDDPENAVEKKYDGESQQLSWSVNNPENIAVGQSVGVEITMGDFRSYQEQAKYLGLLMGVTDTLETQRGRYLVFQVKRKDGSWGTLNRNAADYGTQVKPLSENLSSVEDIDWSSFTIRITRTLTALDVNENCLTFTLGGLALGSDNDPYGEMSGTSMAAPVVTGAVALLASKYGDDPATMKEIRARIVGGVTRTDAMEATCVSGGYLNLEKAMNDPYPVLNTLTQSDDAQGVLDGYFFSDTAGTLTMDGIELTVTSWNDREIQFQLPAGLAAGAHQFVVTNSAQETGQDSFLMTATPGEEASQDAEFFEQLKTPDLDALGVSANVVESASYSMATVGGKIYVTGEDIYMKDENNQFYFALLIYDTTTGNWTSERLMKVPESGRSIKITAGTDRLYIAATDWSESGNCEFSAYCYVVGTKELLTVTESIETVENMYQWSSAFDGTYLWFVGGMKYDDAAGKFVPIENVSRISTVTGQLESMRPMIKARAEAQVQVVNGKLVVTGGMNADGNWEGTTEVWDEAQSVWVIQEGMAPEVYQNQTITAASGTYDGKMILSGMYDNAEHTADTYIYDSEANSWTTLGVKLADTKVYQVAGTVCGDYFYAYGNTQFDDTTTGIFCRYRVRESEKPEPKPEEKPEVTFSDVSKTSVNTGDEANGMIVFLILMILSAVTIPFVVWRKKKNKK